MEKENKWADLVGEIPTPKLCDYCVHKEVCKKYGDETVVRENKCDDYIGKTDPKEYANIYNMFEPVFKWIEYNYPHEDAQFIVKKTGATMFIQHGPVVSSRDYILFDGCTDRQPKEESK